MAYRLWTIRSRAKLCRPRCEACERVVFLVLQGTGERVAETHDALHVLRSGMLDLWYCGFGDGGLGLKPETRVRS